MILSVWLPDWPIQRHRRDAVRQNSNRMKTSEPNTASDRVGERAVANVSQGSGDGSKPTIPLVLYSMHKNALRVTACCRQSRALGVSVGMPLAEARTVTGPDVETCEHNFERDREALRELAVLCRQFSPICGVDGSRSEDQDSQNHAGESDGISLDITGCGHLFGGDAELASKVLQALASHGYQAKGGFGTTVGFAWAAARFGHRRINLISTEQEKNWLDQQPTASLRLPSKTVDALEEFDLRFVGQIRSLPRQQLPSRFGEQLLRRLDQASGQLSESIEPVFPVETPHASWATENPLRTPELVPVVFEKLFGQLASQLPDGVGATSLHAEVSAGQSTVEFDVAFAKPTRCAERFFDLLSLRMERIVLPADVDRVSVAAPQLDLITRVQTDLFGDPLALGSGPGGSDAELDDLLERLSGRVGDDHVLRACLTPDPLPERAIEFVPALATLPQTRADIPALLTRPTTLLATPEPIELWVLDHRPVRVAWQAQIHNVTYAWGPERIEAGWWREDEADQCRDYFRVELADGNCLWLFWDAATGDWFLHGVF